MKKSVFYTEIAYFVGLALLALGTAMMEYGGLGISMVVAPAYILHLKISQIFPYFTFCVAEYFLQTATLLFMMLLLRKVKLPYFLSFLAAVFYGFILDGAMQLTALLPTMMLLQVAIYILGAVSCCAAIALLFSTYLPPEAYELFVKELSAKLHKPVHTVKTVYDCCSLAFAAILSLLLFDSLQGIGVGTVACALLYGFVIRMFHTLYQKLFCFTDRFPLRKYFEESEYTQ